MTKRGRLGKPRVAVLLALIAFGAILTSIPETAKAGPEPDRGIELQTVSPPDGRTRITNVAIEPWRMIVYLEITFPHGTQGGCTGFFVGPRTIATAAHCLFAANEGGWASQVDVYIERNGVQYYARTTARSATGCANTAAVCGDLRKAAGYTGGIFGGGLLGGQSDYGAVVLTDNTLGNRQGWFRLTVEDDTTLRDLAVSVSGYPCAQGEHECDPNSQVTVSNTLWTMSGNITNVSSAFIGYTIDTDHGQSGSAVWHGSGRVYDVVGIHLGPHGRCNWLWLGRNCARRITQEVANDLVAWGAMPPPEVAAISIGQTVGGSLSTSDGRSGVQVSSYYADRYTFSGTARQQVAIQLTSSTFDTFLYLIGPDGRVLARDDNGGGGTNSRIPPGSGYYTLPSSGTYTIEVTSYSPNATGSYTLRLYAPSPSVCIPGNQVDRSFFAAVVHQLQNPQVSAGAIEFAVQALERWARYENTRACWNPLATTLRLNGSWDFNSAGVQNYPDQATGIQATARTLNLSYYDAIRRMLAKEGFDRAAITQALRTWSGNGAYVSSLVADWERMYGCTLYISPTSASFGASGGSGSVSVTAPSGCSWRATSNASWITITSGSSGSGNGTVNYRVAANASTSSRTGTMTIAGQTFIVNQAGVGAPPGPFSLTATPECSGGSPQVRLNWTASSGATSYDVYRNRSLYYSGLTGTQFLNTLVTAGTTYTYYVKARNAYGSTDSNTVTVTAPSCR
jgi:V8-like Glu-specific endopeptidase